VTQRTLPRPRPGEPPVVQLPDTDRRVLESGLRLAAAPTGATGQALFRILLPCGAVCDPPARAGLAALTANLLQEGTEGLDATALNQRLDRLGASVRVRGAHDFLSIGVTALTETLADAVAVLAEMVMRPAFDADALRRVKGEMVDELRAREDEPADRADDRIAHEIFGEHSYGRQPEGTEAGLARLGRDDVLAFHEAHFRPEGAIAVAAGEVDPDSLAGVLEDCFAGWRGAPPPVPEARTAGEPAAAGNVLRMVVPGAAQAEIRVGGRGMTRDDPDWAAGALANYLLGGSTITGRLGANLREAKGWTYGARSGFHPYRLGGSWTVETAVGAEVGDAAVAEIHGELQRLVDEPVPADELARARDALVLSLPHAFATPGRVLGRLATVEAYGLPHDHWLRFVERVRRVEGDAVREIAARHFDPAQLVTVVAGPGEGS
jgi:zinc protease